LVASHFIFFPQEITNLFYFPVLNSHLKKEKNWSYRSFLILYQDVIITSPPFSNNWNRIDDVWAKRFLKEAKELYPDDFESIKRKVRIFILQRDGNS
jgi:hypothetical protein